MEQITLPLHRLFERIKAYDHKLKHKALDTDNYLDLLQLLNQGIGLTSPEDLYLLCETIWRKPHHNATHFRKLFDFHLEEVVIELEKKKQTAEDTEQSPSPSSTETSSDPKKDTQKQEDTKEETKEKTEVANTSETTEEAYETVTLNFGQTQSTNTQLLETGNEKWKEEINEKVFRLRGTYFSILPRKLQQGLRSIRVSNIAQQDVSVDWKATIDRVAKQGYFDAVEWKKDVIVSSDTRLLIDQGGSMVAFQPLMEDLMQAISSSKKMADRKVFYFRNCPVDCVYKDPKLTQAIGLHQFKKKTSAAIFIISDAGAARGSYDEDRIQYTRQFLNQFPPKALVWLNPMPRFRWKNTSAEVISEMIPMFEINQEEFGNAIKVFKNG